jgi:hypothetical protein
MLGVLAVSMFALSAVAVSVASASEHTFLPFSTTSNKFTITSGPGKLVTAGNEIACASDEGSGEVTAPDKVDKVKVLFKGCEATVGTEKCKTQSRGQPEGSILTNTLDGDLGTVATSEAATGVGLLLLPTTGSTFVTVIGKCLPAEETAITGKIAGEVLPVKVKQKSGSVKFALNGASQAIKKIFVLGVEVKPALTAFGLAATLTSTEGITFERELEIS